MALKPHPKLVNRLLVPCSSLERARRVVNVLEMEKGRTLSSRTSSISKPFP
jgi:hypothetical protein